MWCHILGICVKVKDYQIGVAQQTLTLPNLETREDMQMSSELLAH